MDASFQLSALASSQPLDPSGINAATPSVRSEATPSMGADFQNILEGFRQRSNTVEAAGRDLLGVSGAPQSANQKSMRQLADLYTYAVDMQVLLRTGGQLTSGMRQLVTGQ